MDLVLGDLWNDLGKFNYLTKLNGNRGLFKAGAGAARATRWDQVDDLGDLVLFIELALMPGVARLAPLLLTS